jgi:DNA-directed RNA polymerase I subunit RPA49
VVASSSHEDEKQPDSYSYLLQSSAHRRLEYVAKEDDDSGASRLRNHYVGIFDPSTGNLQVIEARNMVMRASVRQKGEGDEEKEQKTVSLTLLFPIEELH